MIEWKNVCLEFVGFRVSSVSLFMNIKIDVMYFILSIENKLRRTLKIYLNLIEFGQINVWFQYCRGICLNDTNYLTKWLINVVGKIKNKNKLKFE